MKIREGLIKGLATRAVALMCLVVVVVVAEGSDDGENDVEAIAEYPDYEYQKPMPKRAALLLDRLLVALQKAVENDEMGRHESKLYDGSIPYVDMSDPQKMQLSDDKAMDLQRRGQAKGRVYWRCYFNAVTCFRRK